MKKTAQVLIPIVVLLAGAIFTLRPYLPEDWAPYLYRKMDSPAVFEKLSPSVVKVVFQMSSNRIEMGSGFFIGSEGWIATNFHVAKHAMDYPLKAYIEYDGAPYPITEYRACSVNSIDICFLRTKVHPRVYFKMPKPNATQTQNFSKGQKLFAIGYPLNVDKAITAGDYLSQNDDIEFSKHTIREDGSVKDKVEVKKFVFSAPVNQGNSGGPVIDEYGRLVGIVTGYTLFNGQRSEGMSLAYDVNTLSYVFSESPKSLSTEELRSELLAKESKLYEKVFAEKVLPVLNAVQNGVTLKAGMPGVVNFNYRYTSSQRQDDYEYLFQIPELFVGKVRSEVKGATLDFSITNDRGLNSYFKLNLFAASSAFENRALASAKLAKRFYYKNEFVNFQLTNDESRDKLTAKNMFTCESVESGYFSGANKCEAIFYGLDCDSCYSKITAYIRGDEFFEVVLDAPTLAMGRELFFKIGPIIEKSMSRTVKTAKRALANSHH